MNVKANLTLRVKSPERDLFLPVAFSSNGRLKSNVAIINGQEQKVAGVYYLDWYQHGRRKRLSVGADPQTALNKKQRKEVELAALAKGLLLQNESDAPTAIHTELEEAIKQYLADAALDRKASTVAAYTTALGYFLESCRRRDRRIDCVEEIEVRDLRRFNAFLRDEKNHQPRSVFNKFSHVVSFLKRYGRNSILKSGDWPVYTEEEVEIYEQEDLDALFAVGTPEENIVWEFFLGTGLRKQEVAYFEPATDIHWKQKTIRVRAKPQYGWTPKAYKEREVPIATPLLARLEPYRHHKGLLFPNSKGRPEDHYWERLRAQARRIEPSQGLPEEGFYLHKFRATFCTRRLQMGFDLRTVMSWMGHNDMTTTMRYLKPARHQDVRSKLDAG